MNTLTFGGRRVLVPTRPSIHRQGGVILFFTLIALVVMSLAAVALIRSVDTSTMIGGNLAFKQAGTSSADEGVEAAIAWLTAAQATMQTNNLNVYNNTTHAFNITGGASGFTTASGAACCANAGYYSNADPTLSLTSMAWNDSNSTLVADASGNSVDSAGNTVRYVIQRMCRTANELPNLNEQPTYTPPKTGCLFSSATLDNNGMAVPYATDICQGAGCPSGGQTAYMRITVQVTGPKNTVSYVQAVAY
jgi:type IV pilus assembly protein PilX